MKAGKEKLAAVIMVALMMAGWYTVLKWLWKVTGLPLEAWRYIVLLLAAGAANYGFIRWLGGVIYEQ